MSIRFSTKLFKLGTWTILRLPDEASAKLPTRSMTVIEGTLNGATFKTQLEPDGKGSHWFRVDKALLSSAKAKAGDIVELDVEPSKNWIRPETPDTLVQAFKHEPKAAALWDDITPVAQWEWVRWLRSAKLEDTRKHRVEVAISKLNSGMRRPCCFNRNLCSEPYVSNNWILRDPE